MNIAQVEYTRIEPEGVQVVFIYDVDDESFDSVVYDTFTIVLPPDTVRVMNMISKEPDPAELLCVLRKMTNVTVH